MGKVYGDLYYTNFPENIDSFEYFSDPSVNDVPIIKQYQSYFNSGNLTDAGKLLEDNPSLQNKIINANNLNKLVDSIKAIQRLYRDDLQTYLMELVSYKGEYSTKTVYSKYDIVLYNGFSYMATSLNCPMGTLPTNQDYFIQLTLKGDQGPSGFGLSPRGSWSNNTQYYTDDLVAYNNVLWAANQDNINSRPNDNSTVWYAVLSLNIILSEIKIANSEIDDVINGTAEFSDDKTGTI